MADTQPPTSPNAGGQKTGGPRPPNRHQQLNKLYALPAPLRTFPLPTLVPHNPLSLFHILFVWLSQTIKTPSTHFDPLYQGWFSPETRSVHVTDQRAIRGLWEQGFYGKGSLSRSEPSWHNRDKTGTGTKKKTTSEETTRQRRAERQKTKWERARKEREAIDQTLSEEAEAALEQEVQMDEAQSVFSDSLSDTNTIIAETEKSPSQSWIFVAPVDPLKLLALPNSNADILAMNSRVSLASSVVTSFVDIRSSHASPVGPLELLALPDKLTASYAQPEDIPYANGHPSPTSTKLDSNINGKANGLGLANLTIDDNEVVGGSETNEDTAEGSTHSEDTVETTSTTPTSAMANGDLTTPKMKRQKSVRFSPTVERNTFIQSEPPSPQHGKVESPVEEEVPLVIKQQEHTQLTLEEAFFLSYGLGALQILDPNTAAPIPKQDLFKLFRQTSHFPPTPNPTLAPDDPFMMNYVVYHHYRSLGWVPRSGVKFSVDLMLYIRGPVFTHAEFGVLILPSYSDPYWSSTAPLQAYVKAKESRTWAWISCINRVITQVKKTLILTYVDVPPPLEKDVEEAMGVDGILARYKVREIVMKRWIANRSRD